jgi:uncharacterized small protein (DUF1192 family)
MGDTSNLVSKFIRTRQEIARLETENDLLKKSNNNNLAESKTRCEKLAIEVNGRHHNAELFQKEIAALSADEIRAKVKALEWQLASQYRVGKKTNGAASLHRQGAREIGPINPELHKIK